jgi:S-adenosylmethionine synthetase
MGVDKEGAGDQGLMFGYACRETEELMPLPIMLSHRLVERLSQVRRSGTLDYLRPDGKSQVSVRYRDGKPVAVETIVVSTQHADHVGQQQIREDIIKHVIQPVVPAALIDPNKILYHINPTGRFVTGGPMGDTGLTGRKIIVDTYGGSCPHGGGAFSGKDPTKVDRSGAYMARHVAKNVVAAGLADSAQVQVAYAIGVPEPVSIMVKTDGAGKLTDRQIEEIVRRQFDFRPRAIIEYLNLRRPIFRKTAAFGHFGRNDPDFTWEATNRVKDLRNAAGI